MLAACEWFLAGEPLANGGYVEIGTGLAGSERIVMSDVVGYLQGEMCDSVSEWSPDCKGTLTVLSSDDDHTSPSNVPGGQYARVWRACCV